ncbi:uncharacterized protein LOC111693813 [Trichogramma pretiosum]|uniref:uncharacterized protein LOC111693813 n=1 Tax=Trichogramma pretiosum TaxID=7493 RepID=UPI000C71A74B|nr:uncharacterized protein LOC111693813 [Trichogramma pretiosum]
MKLIIAIVLLSVASLGMAVTDDRLRRRIYSTQRLIDLKLNTAQNVIRGKLQYAEVVATKMTGQVDFLNDTSPLLSHVIIDVKLNKTIQRGQNKNIDVSQCIIPLNELKQQAQQIQSDARKCIEQQRAEEKSMLDKIKTIPVPFNEELKRIREKLGKCRETSTELLQSLTCYSTILAEIDALKINQFFMVKKDIMQLIADMKNYSIKIFKTCYTERVHAITPSQLLNAITLVDRCILNESNNPSGETTTPESVTEMATYLPNSDDDAETTTPFDEESTTPQDDSYAEGSATGMPESESSGEATTPVAAMVEESPAPVSEKLKETVTEKVAEAVTPAAPKVEDPVTPAAEKVEDPVTPAAEKVEETVSAAPGEEEEPPFKIVPQSVGTYETLPDGTPAVGKEKTETMEEVPIE